MLDASRQAIRLATWDDARIQAYTDAYYRREAGYRDADYNLSGLNDWEETVIADHFSGCSRIIVAGAGGGREALALCRRGFEVAAFDCNSTLLDTASKLARREGHQLKLFLAEPGKAPALTGTWDGAVIGWGSYMHIRGKERRVDFLRQLHARLKRGAPLLISFFTLQPAENKKLMIFRLARLIEFLRGASHVVEKGDTLQGSFDHYFTREEIESEASCAGFRVIAWLEKPYGHAIIQSAESRN
jgi:2-polyprenyl-3-methyl-5-hydroxy-6-metoxy-1,4-benzoquinol methylase